MIRQAISCDICGAEKHQTNHWFVVYTQGSELRVTGWNANRRLRAGSKHLCGQTCLHKLVDEFIAGTMASRTALAPDTIQREEPIAATDSSLTSAAAYASAAPGSPLGNPAARSRQVVPAALIAISPTRALDEPYPPVTAQAFDDPPPTYGSRRWRAEAWERERERERRSAMSTHRKTF
jgi:hypothetical protein